MLKKRIIPCLDVRNGRTVKGVMFMGLRDAGDPVELGKRYADQGADELVFLDITATHEKRKTVGELVKKVAQQVNIPFTVGGGIASVDDAGYLLKKGADKITINSSAVQNPSLVKKLSEQFGEQCIVVAIDAKFEDDDWFVYINGGRVKTNKNLFSWAQHVEKLGAGEILFTSMNHDGTKNGFALEAIQLLNHTVNIPVIASGGAGSKEHFLHAFQRDIDACLAASVFHFHEIDIPDLKLYLQNNQIPVR